MSPLVLIDAGRLEVLRLSAYGGLLPGVRNDRPSIHELNNEKSMKRLILTLFVGFFASRTRQKAQWTVIDPSNLVQNIKSAVQSSTTATNMVKSLQESIKIYNQSKAYYDALKSVA